MPIYLVFALVLLAAAGALQAASPYAEQESRGIKALSPQEVSAYLSGKGMGFAKAAELNGYPGPAHVLELREELGLTAEQESQTEALFQQMKARAVALGEELVEEERSLDQMFARRRVTPALLRSALDRISKLQGEIRLVHLNTHLRQTAVLTSAQIKAYAEFRGYGTPRDHGHTKHKSQ